MKDSDFLSDSQLQEANFGRITQTVEEAQSYWREFNRDYEDIPDFQEKTLFTWVSPERVYNPRRSRSYKRNMTLLLVLIVLLLLFLARMALLIVVLALIFLGFVLVNVPPQKVRHVITNYGIYSGDRFVSWLDRGKRYWYETSQGQLQVIVETKTLPYRLVMLVGHPRNRKQLDRVLGHYLIQQKPAPTKLDEWADWWQKNFALDEGDEVEEPQTKSASPAPEPTKTKSTKAAKTQKTSMPHKTENATR